MSCRNPRFVKAAVVAVIAACAASAAIAAPIVVRASGPSAASYPAGRKLPENSRVTLSVNDQLVVLDARGTRTLRGPGTFNVSAAASSASAQTNYAALVTPQNRRRARTGAVRGDSAPAPAEKRSPNLWYVDTAKSTVACLPDPAAATLWRADFLKPATMTLTDTSTGRSATLNWREAQPTLPWPAAMAPVAGRTYRLGWAGQARPVEVTIAQVAAPATMEQAAETLLANRCEAQLDVLIAGVALPDPVAEPAG